ncbi:MAG: 30S ribosomal protein S1 [Thermodesulfovibrionia bacterium]
MTMEFQIEHEDLYAYPFKRIRKGSVVDGKVVQIADDGVIVDIGYKCEGFIPNTELIEKERGRLRQGDIVSVYVMDTDDSEGFIRLSRRMAVDIKTWQMLEEAFEKGGSVEGRIIGKVKGGMTVDINGLKAFLPGSHIDIMPIKGVDHLIGQRHNFKVLKLNSANSNVIVSRRILLEEERNRLREETLKNLREGILVKGIVKNITDYGAFIDIGGVDGLLHISDMSWGKVSHPAELFSIGEEVEVVVLTFDHASQRVTLGYKQKTPNPWSLIDKRYKVGEKVKGRVVGIVDYGIFIELEKGMEGLVHVSEIDWRERDKRALRYFSMGDVVEAVITNINKDEKRIALSIRQLKQNPWDIVKERYKVGDRVRGVVDSFADFGAFIRLDEGVDALLHNSDISWLKRINHPSEILKKGETIEGVIMALEPERERMSISIKHLTPDPWVSDIPNRYGLGDKVQCRVIHINDSGAIVELDDGVEGIIYASEMVDRDEVIKTGMDITARIINIDTTRRRLCLSMEYC